MNEIAIMMTLDEAQNCVDEIKSGIANVGKRLLELKEREGWRALGYNNWRECGQQEFGYKQSHVYRLLEAADIERNISPIGENHSPIPESHLRPLATLTPDQQRSVWTTVLSRA
jgi:hypothetical protein